MALPLVPTQVVEFTVNEDDDAAFSSPSRRRFEQMLRKLLLLGVARSGKGNNDSVWGLPDDRQTGGGVAVVVLHHYAWHAAVGDGRAAGLFYNTSEAQLGMFADVSMLLGLRLICTMHAALIRGNTPITLYACRFQPLFTVALSFSLHTHLGLQFYDLPQVSMRNAMWPLMAAGVDGFKASS